ncbi:MAG: hypothetical protein JXR03_14110 [Cyclobacteriaceae bacterium]
MKKFPLTLLVFILTLSAYSQTIRIADNNAGAPTGTHVYATLQEAIDATVPGDIIHVIPSPNNYGDVTIEVANSGISIFGIGFNPDKDGPAKSNINRINVYGSDIRISGLVISDYIFFGTNSNTLSNVSVENCDIDRIDSSTSTSFTGSNIIIRNCFVGRPATFDVAISLSNRISNSVITNCILGGYTGTSTAYGSILAYNGAVIKNNIFFGDGDANRNAFDGLFNSTVSNNIFFGRQPQDRNGMTNTTFNNNIAVGTANDALPPKTSDGVTGNSNITSITDATLIFENASIIIGNSWDLTWEPTLASGATALVGTGVDGTDVGPTGSTIPWDGTGVSLPLIQSVISSEVIKQGDNLDVTIKARGN